MLEGLHLSHEALCASLAPAERGCTTRYVDYTRVEISENKGERDRRDIRDRDLARRGIALEEISKERRGGAEEGFMGRE